MLEGKSYAVELKQKTLDLLKAQALGEGVSILDLLRNKGIRR
jgi:hypothetical protein